MGEYSNRQTAQMAALIKRNRKKARNMQRKADMSGGFNLEASVLSEFLTKENRNLSTTFRAMMIYNAFMKGRKFTSAECELYSLGENAVESLKVDLDAYSQYCHRRKNQQKALNIVRHQLVRKDEVDDFVEWVSE